MPLTFHSPLMKRSLSVTMMRQGSESEDEEEEESFEDTELACCAAISITKAARICAVATVAQAVLNFFIFLYGCIHMVHIISATLPLISSVVVGALFAYSTIHRSSLAVRPFLAYHLTVLCLLALLIVVFICSLLSSRLPAGLLSLLDALPTTVFREYFNTRETTGRLLYSLFLLGMATINVVCLHVAVTLYVHLDSSLPFLKTGDTTDVF